jgi:hypothetical protein
MSVPLTILQQLKPNFPNSAVVLNQRFSINRGHWSAVHTLTGDPEVAWLLANLPNGISRQDVIGLTDPTRTVLRRRIAVAALMWGYGVSGFRWGKKLDTALSTMLGQQLNQVLAGCEANLLNNNVEAAYRDFVKIGRGGREDSLYASVGPPFFSKILYFLGKNLGMKKYPLILDTKVSINLAQLTGFRLLVRPADCRPLPDSGAYGLYVEYMHAWAASLAVAPEVIEAYLWEHASNPAFWSLCRKAHIAQFP